jgi:hypothetical protein
VDHPFGEQRAQAVPKAVGGSEIIWRQPQAGGERQKATAVTALVVVELVEKEQRTTAQGAVAAGQGLAEGGGLGRDREVEHRPAVGVEPAPEAVGQRAQGAVLPV